MRGGVSCLQFMFTVVVEESDVTVNMCQFSRPGPNIWKSLTSSHLPVFRPRSSKEINGSPNCAG